MKDLKIITRTQDIQEILHAFINNKKASYYIMRHLEEAIFKQFRSISFGLTPPKPNGGSDSNYLFFNKRIYSPKTGIDIGLRIYYKLPYNIYLDYTSLLGQEITAFYIKKEVIHNKLFYDVEKISKEIEKYIYWDWFPGENN